MSQWNLIVDVAECVNCNNCVLAAKDEHCDNDFPGYAAPQPQQGHYWIGIERRVRGNGGMVDAAYRLRTCNHCRKAPCIGAAGDGAVYRRPDGIVIIDPAMARGRKDIVEACPYGAIWWNDARQIPQKWVFDAHLLDQGWKTPRCEQACPTGAIRSLKISNEEMYRIVESEGLRVIRPELGTEPRVYYRNMNRFDRCFIGGNAVAEVAGTLDNVIGAKVVVSLEGDAVAELETDAFGDFKLDDLDPHSGTYRIVVSHQRYGKASVEISLDESCYIGSLVLRT